MSTNVKVDHKVLLKQLYRPPKDRPVLVDVPELSYLMVDGAGDPNSAPAFRDAIQALYSISYTLKFMRKRERDGQDYTVMPLEALWWGDDETYLGRRDKREWTWTAMIMQPGEVTAELLNRATQEAGRKRPLSALSRVRFEPFDEGRCAQIMHLGPYAAEGPTIDLLTAFIAEQGLRRRGRHHEIYLGDPRRSATEKLKTIIRQPVARP